jgi:hypothetical protein
MSEECGNISVDESQCSHVCKYKKCWWCFGGSVCVANCCILKTSGSIVLSYFVKNNLLE